MQKPVLLPPGGTLGDYVPFYFAPLSPMLYAIHRGQVEGYVGGQSEVVHLASTVEAVAEAKLAWVFTEGHAEIRFTGFFNDLGDLDKIDWGVMRGRYWYDTDNDPDRKRRRQAEFLVRDFFPWALISHIGVCNRNAELLVTQALEHSPHKPNAAVERSWYY